MFRRVYLAAVVANLFILAACAQGQSISQVGSGAAPKLLGAGLPSIAPDKGCRGTGGVRVMPCPVRLTRHTKQGVLLTVTGPGVVNSYLDELNGCFSGKLCYNIERDGSSQIQWRLTSGKACGGASIEFDGVGASGREVGHFFLRVSNSYCP